MAEVALQPAWRLHDPKLAADALALWQRLDAMPPEVAESRAKETSARSRATPASWWASRPSCSIICRSSATGSLSSAAWSIPPIVSKAWPAAWRSTHAICWRNGRRIIPRRRWSAWPPWSKAPNSRLVSRLPVWPASGLTLMGYTENNLQLPHRVVRARRLYRPAAVAAGAHPGGASKDRHGVAQERSRDQGQGDGVVEPAWRRAGRHYGGGTGGPTQRRGVRWRQSRRRCHQERLPNCRSCGVASASSAAWSRRSIARTSPGPQACDPLDPSLRGVVKEQSARESARRGHHHRKSQARGDQQAAGVVFTRDQEWAGPDRAHAARPTDPGCRGSSTHASTRRGHRPVGT